MQPGRGTGILNILTAALLALTIVLAAGFLVINLNPEAAVKLFPTRAGVGGSLVDLPTAFVPLVSDVQTEAPAEAALQTARPTATPERSDPSETPLATGSSSRTPRPTLTPSHTPTATPTSLVPVTPFATLVVIATSGPSPTATWTRSPFQFTVQGEAPFAVENVFNLAGCSWMGVGGQVYDTRGGPLIGYVVHIEGGGLNANSLSGTQPQYGPAGYEFKLAGAPEATIGVYRLQLRDPQNTAVSDWVRLETYDDCKKNVLLVNFLKNH